MSPDHGPTPKVLKGTLREIVERVAEEEGFKVETLPSEYEPFYTQVLPTGHRCVDGRAVKPEMGARSDPEFGAEQYKGMQLSGGSLGVVNAVRLVSALDEKQAREVVKAAADQLRQRLGDHIDDKHGHLDGPQLKERFEGCGNQDAIAAGKLPMYKGIEIDVADRMRWLEESGGVVAVLTGDHQEQLAAVNLVPETTFDTCQAVSEGKSTFNADLPEVWQFAGAMYEQLPDSARQEWSQEEFQQAIVEAVMRDYLQTLKALGALRTVYIRE